LTEEKETKKKKEHSELTNRKNKRNWEERGNTQKKS